MANTTSSITVLVAERQPLMQWAIASAFSQHSNIRVLGFTQTFSETAAQLLQVKPRILIYNLAEDSWSARQAITDLLKLGSHSDAPVDVVVYSQNEKPSFIAAALKAGARGYLNTQHDGKNLIMMVECIAAGETYENQDMITALNHPVLIAASHLTPTERDILRAVVKGAENQPIADLRLIALSTVKKHATNIYRKLHVETRAQVVALAIRFELVEPEP